MAVLVFTSAPNGGECAHFHVSAVFTLQENNPSYLFNDGCVNSRGGLDVSYKINFFLPETEPRILQFVT
jgi:hypothetical protein